MLTFSKKKVAKEFYGEEGPLIILGVDVNYIVISNLVEIRTILSI